MSFMWTHTQTGRRLNARDLIKYLKFMIERDNTLIFAVSDHMEVPDLTGSMSFYDMIGMIPLAL